ncbi:MAG: gluconate 2-dehydrogenase subunit 3 family protein [Algoriphagus sp.]|nr:gluconate 2-dehydrogenase subunit 3 family protein [Algoriphagus sp.]
MERREAIKWVASLFGGTLIGAEAFLAGCTTDSEITFFSSEEMNLLDEIGDTILPETSKSPGAKAAKIADFMQKIVRDCYSAEEQGIFKSGLIEVEEKADQQFNNSFLKLSGSQRLDILYGFEEAAKEKKENDPSHFFRMLKQLTIWGFFTSEVGATKALRYDPIPGSYEGCVDLKPGQPAWY